VRKRSARAEATAAVSANSINPHLIRREFTDKNLLQKWFQRNAIHQVTDDIFATQTG